jgi:membrane-bound inhibitor of C-type lysozyme
MMTGIDRFKCRAALFVTTLLLLGGCAQTVDRQQSYSVIDYQCNNAQFSLTFIDDEQVLLLLDNAEYHLTRVPAASGSRYVLNVEPQSEQHIVLHTKGSQARLEVDSTLYSSCVTAN